MRWLARSAVVLSGLAACATAALAPLSDDTNVVKQLKQNCEERDLQSCYRLGAIYQLGNEGIVANPTFAAQLYRDGCDHDYPPSCNGLGGLYMNGQGVNRDFREAVRLFRRSCELSYADGCSNLAHCYQHGEGVAKDVEVSARLYNQACQAGYAQACVHLGELLEESGRRSQLARSTELYLHACEAKVAVGCAYYADMLRDGKGIRADPDRAHKYYGYACELGYDPACANAETSEDGDRTAQAPRGDDSM
jgi:TPR repeat protein